MIVDLLWVIIGLYPSKQEDRWWWWHSKDGNFYVSSAYTFLQSRELSRDTRDSYIVKVLLCIWSSWTPSRLRFSLDSFFRTGSLLEWTFLRGGFFGVMELCLSYLLDGHQIIFSSLCYLWDGDWVWYRIFRWSGWVMVLPRDVVTLFQMFFPISSLPRLRWGRFENLWMI